MLSVENQTKPKLDQVIERLYTKQKKSPDS